MRRAVITGVHGKIPTTPTPRENIPNGRAGWFTYDWDSKDERDTLSLIFKRKLLLDPTLRGKEQDDVVAHERRHETDFLGLANALQRPLDAAYKQGDVDLDLWMKWFDYDVVAKSNAFHIAVGAPTDLNFPPSDPRPWKP
jgi:hypothetical protein